MSNIIILHRRPTGGSMDNSLPEPIYVNTAYIVAWQPDYQGSLLWLAGRTNFSEGSGGSEPIRVLETPDKIASLTRQPVLRAGTVHEPETVSAG